MLNSSEAEVDRSLVKFAHDNGYRVHVKPRLRDVLDLDGVRLTSRERNFSFTAHVDFVVADAQSNLPVLTIEYDGPQHMRDRVQQGRDQGKDRLCEVVGLPMLRIDNQFARRSGRWRVLAYILEMHEAGKASRRAQEDGHVPWDLPFIHNFILDIHDPSRPQFTRLDQAALVALRGTFRHVGSCGTPNGGATREATPKRAESPGSPTASS